MDLATVIGLGGGTGLIFISMALTPTGLGIFIDLNSIIITIFGSLSALLASQDLNVLKNVGKYLSLTFKKTNFDKTGIIRTLIELSEKARKEGLLSLDDGLEEIQDDFLKRGMRLVVDGTDPEIIKTMLELNLEQIQERHKVGISLFDNWGKLCPAFGMIGTLIGLIALMGNLEDKSALGASMAVALITTLYGSIVANLYMLPIKIKLESLDNEELLLKNMMIEGILSIQAGDNPRVLEQKLITFIKPEERGSFEDGKD